MTPENHTVSQHIELLHEKGYLSPDFQSPAQLGSWIREFEQQVDQCIQQAHVAGEVTRFSVDLNGKFNNHLETVRFNLRYSYHPDTEILILNSLHARLYHFSRPFYLPHATDLPAAQEVYDRLAKAVALSDNRPLFNHLVHEFNRDKNIDNDTPTPDPADQQRHPQGNDPRQRPLTLKIRR
jgi:hypothetical protein